MKLLKYIFFSTFFLFFLVIFGWIFDLYLLILQPFVILSWYLNNNKCILSEIEYKIFKSTIISNEKKILYQKSTDILYILVFLRMFYTIFFNFFILYNIWIN